MVGLVFMTLKGCFIDRLLLSRVSEQQNFRLFYFSRRVFAPR